jgi:hypothetical protein
MSIVVHVTAQTVTHWLFIAGAQIRSHRVVHVEFVVDKHFLLIRGFLSVTFYALYIIVFLLNQCEVHVSA